MPVTHAIDADARLVGLFYDGAPAFEEWEAAMRAVFADPAYRPGFGFVVDRRCVAPPTTDFVRRVAEFVREHSEELAGSRWATLAGSPAAYGMARMGQTLAEGFGGEARVFTDPDHAERWLRGGPPADA